MELPLAKSVIVKTSKYTMTKKDYDPLRKIRIHISTDLNKQIWKTGKLLLKIQSHK